MKGVAGPQSGEGEKPSNVVVGYLRKIVSKVLASCLEQYRSSSEQTPPSPAPSPLWNWEVWALGAVLAISVYVLTVLGFAVLEVIAEWLP